MIKDISSRKLNLVKRIEKLCQKIGEKCQCMDEHHSLFAWAITIFYTRGEHKKLLFTTLNLTTLYCSAAVPNKKLLQMQLIFWSVLVFCAYHCHAKTSQKTIAITISFCKYLPFTIFSVRQIQLYLRLLNLHFINVLMLHCGFQQQWIFQTENT